MPRMKQNKKCTFLKINMVCVVKAYYMVAYRIYPCVIDVM